MSGFPIIQKYCPPRYSWYPPKVDSSSPMIFGLCKEFIFVLMCFLVTQFWNTFPNCLLKNTSHEITQKGEKKVSAPNIEFSMFLSQTNIHRLSKLFVVLLRGPPVLFWLATLLYFTDTNCCSFLIWVKKGQHTRMIAPWSSNRLVQDKEIKPYQQPHP